METDQGTVAIWQSGRLAPHLVTRRFAFGRAQWLGAALLLLSAMVLAIYMGVLERDVGAGEVGYGQENAARATVGALTGQQR